ncbi:hypothetical protein RHS04_06296 [Rhizoctonia solani]|uniref:DUF6533 domain-containing protein n=1 Tax=Rhizoctonia solani TaxID=456999 RepID=A0A8H7H4K9_9AGAM|nr:hypothetical protein RHS04_06296 [Rhizoctonia solani]
MSTVITFADEVNLIWPAKFGVVKFIFFVNRYIGSVWIAVAYTGEYLRRPNGHPLVKPYNILCSQLWIRNFSHPFIVSTLHWLHFIFLDLNIPSCRAWIVADTYMEITNIQLLNFIINIRVYDIWQSRQLAFLVLIPLWIVHLVVDYTVVTINAIRTSPQYGYSPAMSMCTADPRGLWIVWLNGIAYHSLILLLLIWIWLSTPRTEQTPLVRLVLRDGFIYFVAILSMMMFNLMVWRYARPSMVLLPYHVVWVFLNGSLSRILLSLGSVQTSEEWGQRAKLRFIPGQIELANVFGQETVPTYIINDEHGKLIKSRTVQLCVLLTSGLLCFSAVYILPNSLLSFLNRAEAQALAHDSPGTFAMLNSPVRVARLSVPYSVAAIGVTKLKKQGPVRPNTTLSSSLSTMLYAAHESENCLREHHDPRICLCRNVPQHKLRQPADGDRKYERIHEPDPVRHVTSTNPTDSAGEAHDWDRQVGESAGDRRDLLAGVDRDEHERAHVSAECGAAQPRNCKPYRKRRKDSQERKEQGSPAAPERRISEVPLVEPLYLADGLVGTRRRRANLDKQEAKQHGQALDEGVD